jgi:hypothetical protein
MLSAASRTRCATPPSPADKKTRCCHHGRRHSSLSDIEFVRTVARGLNPVGTGTVVRVVDDALVVTFRTRHMTGGHMVLEVEFTGERLW